MKLKIFSVFILTLVLMALCSVFSVYAYVTEQPVYTGDFTYWIKFGFPNKEHQFVCYSNRPFTASQLRFVPNSLFIDSVSGTSFVYIKRTVISNRVVWEDNYSQVFTGINWGYSFDPSVTPVIVSANYNIDGLYTMPLETFVQVYVGDNELVESEPDSRNINYIDGYDSIKMFWINQPRETHNFSMYAIKSGFLGIESTVNIDDVTSYSNEYLYNLTKPNTEYVYKLMVEDESSPYTVFDGFTGKTRFYYFKFNSAIKPNVTISGAVNNSTVENAPVITVSKENSTKQYDLFVNGRKIYMFTQNAMETYKINPDVFDLGHNTVAVYDGINLVKGLDFIIKPSGSGNDGTGGVIPPNGEDGPLDEYEPPPVDEGRPVPPDVNDEWSQWVLYYLKSILYWVEMPFKLLLNLLKDISKNVIEVCNEMLSMYTSMFDLTKKLFSWLPPKIASTICVGFALAILLWFVQARKK